ncbi:MAG: PP2C family protein-serine/threonine phosphatase [Planctomycetota bacterium]
MERLHTEVGLDPSLILDSLNDGVYAVDPDRRIVYWGKSAEAITGWTAGDVLDKHCRDGVLCHIDKDGHELCGEEHCPLHRAMVTGQASTTPVIVFAKGKDGGRIPMRVSVAPIRDESGKVVGGVESFRDLSGEIGDIERAGKIQSLALQNELPQEERIRFARYYIPCDIIGGDYYAITKLGDDCYGFMLADVTGHGVPAALYTMFLSSLWEAHNALLISPSAFTDTLNESLCHLIREEGHFATAICGCFDLAEHKLHLTSAGGPPPLVFRSSGECEQPTCAGLPLGCIEDIPYGQDTLDLHGGDCVLFFSDGVIEVSQQDHQLLDVGGLMEILHELGYPRSDATFKAIEERMLKASDRIRFDDDLTFLEVRLP